MKRFFKTGAACALALALMSTSAFAAVSGGKAEFVDGKLNVTITGTTPDEQVALLVLKGDKQIEALANVQNTDIAYIDQKAGGESLAFNGINVGTVETVTVFAGSSNTTVGAFRVGAPTTLQPALTASAKSFNVAAGAETTVNLTLINEKKQPVTDATVTYRVKDSGNAFEEAGSRVSYVENVGWKFNFSKAGTYEVKFTKGTVSEIVYVCAYINKPVEGIGKKDDPSAEKKSFVMQPVPDSTKVVAAVRVNLEGKATTGKEKEKIIWSIRTNETGDNQYYSSPIEVNLGSLSGALDLVCKFDNNTGSDVTAVNVIYKDAAGKVFFTDPTDAGREDAGSEEQK